MLHRRRRPVNPDYCTRVFRNAILTGEASNLRHLIQKKKFNVNYDLRQDSLNETSPLCPLVKAIDERCIPVVTLLLENQASVNYEDGLPLKRAIIIGDQDLVRLIIDTHEISGINLKGALITAIETAESSNNQESISILELLLIQACRLSSRRFEAQVSYEDLNKYAQLCRAIIEPDETWFNELLKKGYIDYASALGDGNRPSRLAVRLRRTDFMNTFMQKGIDVKDIFFEAVRKGDHELMQSCFKCPGFNPRALSDSRKTALHWAFEGKQFEIADKLIKDFGLDLNLQDSDGRSAIFSITDPDILRYLLDTYTEVQVNLKTSTGRTMLDEQPGNCDWYVTLLEYGADPQLGQNNRKHQCRKGKDCPVVHHLQKLDLIDPTYVSKIVPIVLKEDIEVFRLRWVPEASEYRKEIEIMKQLQISQSTSYSSGKNLYDFMFSTANKSAIFSRNEHILQIYKDTNNNFRNNFPHYGCILNFMLRRGAVRRERLESSIEFFSSALGGKIPNELSEIVFGNLSNSTLKHFSTEMME